MAYRDPYANRLQSQPHETPDFDPYYASRQPYQSYDESGPPYDTYGSRYEDDLQPRPLQIGGPQRNFGGKESLSPDISTPVTGVTGERTARALRDYRYGHQGQLWTKGGRGRCIGRFCCCTLMITLLLFVSIALTLVLWVRPPNVSIGEVQTVSKSGSAIQLQEDGITINLGVPIAVDNPNYFAINFKQIKAQIFYPINNTGVGEGILNDVMIRSNTQTNLTFPFSIDYKIKLDPGNLILKDLAQKCGLRGSKSDLSVRYKITLQLRVLFIPIAPVVSNSFSFACPINPSDLEELIKNAGLNLDGLLGSG